MPTLLSRPVADLWDNLKWTAGELHFMTSKNKPLDVPSAPNAPGLYRAEWTNADTWSITAVHKQFNAKSTKQIPDPILDFSDRGVPCVLTIGRTTNIRKRLRQHFSTNTNNNRLLMRLRCIVEGYCDDTLRKLAARSLRIEWVKIENWVERSLFEAYGKAFYQPIFDIDAEH